MAPATELAVNNIVPPTGMGELLPTDGAAGIGLMVTSISDDSVVQLFELVTETI